MYLPILALIHLRLQRFHYIDFSLGAIALITCYAIALCPYSSVAMRLLYGFGVTVFFSFSVDALSYLLVRRHSSSPTNQLIVSVALLSIVGNAISILIGSKAVVLSSTPNLIVLGQLIVTQQHFMVFGIAGLTLILLYSSWIRQHLIRSFAIGMNPSLARSWGLNTPSHLLVIFVLGALLTVAFAMNQMLCSHVSPDVGKTFVMQGIAPALLAQHRTCAFLVICSFLTTIVSNALSWELGEGSKLAAYSSIVMFIVAFSPSHRTDNRL